MNNLVLSMEKRFSALFHMHIDCCKVFATAANFSHVSGDGATSVLAP